MPSEIAIPFRVSSDGRVVTTSDPDAQIRQHVFSLINTQVTERVMLPTYGVATNSLIFENMDTDEVEAQAITMITSAFSTWEPGVLLLRAAPVPSKEGDFTARIDVNYARKDSADTSSSISSNMAVIGANGTVKEVVRG